MHNHRIPCLKTALVPDHEVLRRLSAYLVEVQRKDPHIPHIDFPGCPRSSDIEILGRSTPPPGVSSSDLADIVDLYQDLRKICQHAQEKNVRIIIDAEHR